MTALGDFQPVFELATGIHLGVSGLLAIFEDPRDKQIGYAGRMLKSLRNLRDAAAQCDPSTRKELDDYISKSAKDFDAEVRKSRDHRKFTIAKLLSVAFGLIGIYYVSYCSDNAGLPLTNLVWIIGHICILSPIFIVFFSLLPAYRGAMSVATVRAELDSAYDKMVFEVYKKGGAAS